MIQLAAALSATEAVITVTHQGIQAFGADSWAFLVTLRDTQVLLMHAKRASTPTKTTVSHRPRSSASNMIAELGIHMPTTVVGDALILLIESPNVI